MLQKISRTIKDRLYKNEQDLIFLSLFKEQVVQFIREKKDQKEPQFTVRLYNNTLYIKGENKTYANELRRMQEQITTISKKINPGCKKIVFL